MSDKSDDFTRRLAAAADRPDVRSLLLDLLAGKLDAEEYSAEHLHAIGRRLDAIERGRALIGNPDWTLQQYEDVIAHLRLEIDVRRCAEYAEQLRASMAPKRGWR